MISKTIKYVDYNGLEKEETFWFNMSRTDLMRMEASEEGGWEQRLRKMIAEKDANKAYLFFERFIQESYGVITPDGGFDKDERHYKKFRSTAAYDDFIWYFIEHPDEAGAFINGITATVKKSEVNTQIDAMIEQQTKNAGSKVMDFVTPKNP